MFEHRLTDRVSSKVYSDWFILSFTAGFINVGGFLSCQRFVSHVTGFATLAGVDIAKLNFSHAMSILSIPIYFLMGVIISGYVTEKMLVHRAQERRYAPMLAVAGVILAVVAIGGFLGKFGIFGEAAEMSHDYALLALLCMASGIQNAAVTSSSGATVRTTHLTGITTDLGLGLIRAEVHNLSPDHRQRERKANIIRLGFIGSFFIGSSVGALAFGLWQYLGFLVPSFLSFYIYIAARLGRK